MKESYSYAFAEDKYPGAPEWNIHLIDSDPFFVEPSEAGRKLVWVRDKGYCHVNADGTCSPTGGNRIVNAEKVQANDAADSEGNGKGVAIIPIRGMHDQMPVLGFRFGGIAYLTDMSSIPESDFSLAEAVEIAERINARHTWLTHLSHTFPTYGAFDAELRQFTEKIEIHPAFDGLKIES